MYSLCMNYQLASYLLAATRPAALSRVIDTASAVSVGLLAGALLIESAVLVPYWRTLSPHEFGVHHHGFAERLYRFFAPLTMVAVALSLLSGLRQLWPTYSDEAGGWLTLAGSALAVSLLVFYGLYFRTANIRLPEVARAGNQTQLDAALRQWHSVHRVRTAVSLVALLLLILGLSY